MNSVSRHFIALLGALVVSIGVAYAHHSYAAFDTTKEVSIKGAVREFKFQNPHTTIVITTIGKDGRTTDWYFEAASVRGLVNKGWRKSTLKPGDTVTLVGHPIRDGRPGASLVRAILADGTVLQANALEIPNY